MRQRIPRGAAPCLTVAAAFILLTSACGLIGSDDAEDQGSDTDEAGEPVQGGAVDPGESEPRETIASQDVADLETDLHIAVHELSRGAETTELTFSITNTGDDPSALMHSFLARGDSRDVSAVELVDPSAGRVHLVARDADDNCVCSRYDGADRFEAGESVLYSATFGAPPEETEAMTVRLPMAGSLTDVPLS